MASSQEPSWLQLWHVSRSLLGRDDERDPGVTSGHVKAFGIIAAAELVALAVVVAIVLHGDQRTVFPPAVPVVATAGANSKSSVPVSVTLRMVGSTKTAALISRGGKAAAISSSSDSGFVAKRPSAKTPETARSSRAEAGSTAPIARVKP